MKRNDEKREDGKNGGMVCVCGGEEIEKGWKGKSCGLVSG